MSWKDSTQRGVKVVANIQPGHLAQPPFTETKKSKAREEKEASDGSWLWQVWADTFWGFHHLLRIIWNSTKIFNFFLMILR